MGARLRLLALACAAVLGASVTAGCTRSGTDADCRSVCTGTAGDASYAIRVPARWNGTLLLYSHGFEADGPGHHPYLSAADQGGDGSDAISAQLLAQGYALAGSAYPSTGWDVTGAVDAAVALHDRFVQLVGRPRAVIAWGSSMGGLITELLAEREPWVDAAAPMCGVLAGTQPNVDRWTRAVALVHGLTGADLSVNGQESVDDLTDLSIATRDNVNAMTHDADGGAPALLALASALGLPGRSPAHSSTTRSSRELAAAQNVAIFARLGVLVLSDLTLRFGAGSGDAAMGDLRIGTGTQLRADLAALRVDVPQLQAYLAGTPAPAVDARARRAMRADGSPTFRVRVPTITMHTTVDPAVIPANETYFRDRVDRAGRGSLLRQVWIGPSTTTAPATGSAQALLDSGGLGHCAFTTAQQVGLIGAVATWLRTRAAPTSAALGRDIGAGVAPSYRPPSWPS